MRLLRVDSSAREGSVTRRLTGAFTAEWRQAHPEGEVMERDLAAIAMPYITDDWLATMQDPAKLTERQRNYLSVSDLLIAELAGADVVVIGAPVYNFTVSWPLKAWIDQVVRLGKTVEYGPGGPRGLLTGKSVVVVSARGGEYSQDMAAKNFDIQEYYLRRILGFIGLNDLEFIHADNQMRPEAALSSMTAAVEEVMKAAARAA